MVLLVWLGLAQYPTITALEEENEIQSQRLDKHKRVLHSVCWQKTWQLGHPLISMPHCCITALLLAHDEVLALLPQMLLTTVVSC